LKSDKSQCEAYYQWLDHRQRDHWDYIGGVSWAAQGDFRKADERLRSLLIRLEEGVKRQESRSLQREARILNDLVVNALHNEAGVHSDMFVKLQYERLRKSFFGLARNSVFCRSQLCSEKRDEALLHLSESVECDFSQKDEQFL
jgi:hypothetical protein